MRGDSIVVGFDLDRRSIVDLLSQPLEMRHYKALANPVSIAILATDNLVHSMAAPLIHSSSCGFVHGLSDEIV